MPANRALFGVYNQNAYVASQNYINTHMAEFNQDDNTPAYMNYSVDMPMNTMLNPQFTQDYTNHMYDIAVQYVNRHSDAHAAAQAAAQAAAAEAEAAAEAAVGGRRRDNRGRNTRGHIKLRSRSRSRSRSRKSNKRMRRTRRR